MKLDTPKVNKFKGGNKRFIRSGNSTLNRNYESRSNQGPKSYKISSILDIPPHLTSKRTKKREEDGPTPRREKLMEYLKASKNPFNAHQIMSNRNSNNNNFQEVFKKNRRENERKTKPGTGSRGDYVNQEIYKNPSFLTEESSNYQETPKKVKKHQENKTPYSTYLDHLNNMNKNSKNQLSTIDTRDQRTLPLKDEWLPGAIRCCERKHLKTEGGKVKQSILKVFDFEDGRKEIVEWNIQEVISKEEEEEDEVDILQRHLDAGKKIII